MFCEQIEEHVKLENGAPPKIYLKERESGSAEIDLYQLAIINSNYKLVLVTKNMSTQKWLNLLKQEAIMDAVFDRTVIPVFLREGGGKGYTPFALKGIQGIDISESGKFSFDHVTRALNTKLPVRLQNERNFIKKRERAIFLQKIQIERENLVFEEKMAKQDKDTGEIREVGSSLLFENFLNLEIGILVFYVMAISEKQKYTKDKRE